MIGMRAKRGWVVLAAMVLPAAGAEGQWTAERVAVIEGFQTPESAAVEPTSGAVYVSNVVAAKAPGPAGPYWSEDGAGYVSRLKPGGQIDVARWKQKTAKGPLSGPKGICFGWRRLWVADITRIAWFDLAGERADGATAIAGARRLNDTATDGTAVYASDTAAGKVHRIARGERHSIKAPQGVNGITFFDGKMYAVSWTLHDVFLLDPTGKAEPRPFGLAAHFKSLDGIEVLPDGTFLVSDFQGNKVWAIPADGKSVRTLLETTTPADIGVDRKRLLLYVPLFSADRVEVYQLKSK